MDSSRPYQDLWLQRSRLDGMTLAAFIYGIYFHLSIEAFIVVRRSRRSSRLGKWKARTLQLYIAVTFLLSTLGFACNARYTEDIWINLTSQRTPEELIVYELDFWWNRTALASNFIMIWIMDLLLLYRCFVIWNYYTGVVVGLMVVYLGVIGLSIVVIHYAQHNAVFSNIKVQIAFLVLSCVFNILYTILVSTRLLTVRKRIIDALGTAHAKMYTSLMAMLVESAALYFIFDVVFIFAFGFKSNVQNLIFLEYSNIQGIAELLIIVRVAKGQDYDGTLVTATTRQDYTPPMSTDTNVHTTADLEGASSVKFTTIGTLGTSNEAWQRSESGAHTV